MRVLQICSKMPYPETDGGCRAMAELSRGLYEQGIDLHIAGFKTHKHPGTKEISANSAFQKPVTPFEIDIRIKPANLFTNLFFSKSSYNLSRFHSTDAAQKCGELIKSLKPELIILDGFFTSPLLPVIRNNSRAPVVYRSHNLEWKLWESRSKQAGNIASSLYFRLMSKRLRKEEEAFAAEVDAFLFISEEEEAFFHSWSGDARAMLLPYTIEDPASTGKKVNQETIFYHIGAMDWFPNVQGMDWFLKEVWPRFRQLRPDAKMLLAGKGMPERWKQAQIPGLMVLGEVENPLSVLGQADILVAPVFSASGVRIKILEAMSHGKPVITNTAGKQGLVEKHLQGLLTADCADEYLSAMTELYDYPEKREALSLAAIRYTSAYHLRSKIYASVTEFLRSLKTRI